LAPSLARLLRRRSGANTGPTILVGTILSSTPNVAPASRSKPVPPIERHRIISCPLDWPDIFFWKSSLRDPVYHSRTRSAHNLGNLEAFETLYSGLANGTAITCYACVRSIYFLCRSASQFPCSSNIYQEVSRTLLTPFAPFVRHAGGYNQGSHEGR